MKKKILAGVLTTVFALSTFVGCGSAEKTETTA